MLKSRDQNVTRREFAVGALAIAGTSLCPCAFAAPQKPSEKPRQYSLISVSAICCGTCQHWKGERMLVDRGLRVKCQATASSPCFRGAGFKYPAISPAASHGCVSGKFYKKWVELP